MAVEKVMLVRHAEKPDEAANIRGVDEYGRTDPNQLSVRGWQRAGALVRFFAPMKGQTFPAGIATPSSIFACSPRGASSSLRPESTVRPLAAALGIAINAELVKAMKAP